MEPHILGVNMGTVGFLTNIVESELEKEISRLITGDYKVEERMMLEILYIVGKVNKTNILLEWNGIKIYNF